MHSPSPSSSTRMMHPLIMMHSSFNMSFVLLCIFIFFIAHIAADEVTIQGDTQVISDTEGKYYVSLDRRYPSIFFFGYEFTINLPTPVKEEVLASTQAEFSHSFKKVPVGSYEMSVEVYIYFFQQKAWKVGEKSINIQIKDSLDDFFSFDGKQDGLPNYTPKYVYVTNKTVSFVENLQVPNSVLSSDTTILDYKWILNGPNLKDLQNDNSTFDYNFTQNGEYSLDLEVTANITKYSLIKTGKVIKNIFLKSPITNFTVVGNLFVENGSLLHMNVTCNGSSNFQICYFFSDTISNKSCFDTPIILTNCFQHISHYFPQNGTQYINIGIRNDVSEMTKHDKITIYKVGPKPSLVFVILPLASAFLVIIIILIGIAHHIKQRRKLNATIEVATMENFGLYGHSNSMCEKTFFERIQDTLKGLFRSR